jgi:hypothetical protein
MSIGVYVFKNTKDPSATLRLDMRDKYVLFNLKIGGGGYAGSIGHAYATPEEALVGFCKGSNLFNKDIFFHDRVPDDTIITSWELVKEEN